MNEKLENALVKDFPKLYRQRYLSMRETAMCWGFDCGDGWHKIIRDLSQQLAHVTKVSKIKIEATQVKEKYARLRFYFVPLAPKGMKGKVFDQWDSIIQTCVSHAEWLSLYTCEVCGERGKRRKRGPWLLTRCDECWKKENVPVV